MSTGIQLCNVGLQRPARNGARTVLANVSAAFPAGRVALITGETGSGKSTLLHILGALLKPTEGEVYADGQPVSRWTARYRDCWRQRVGLVLQHFHLIRELTVMENLMLPLLPHGDCLPELRRRAWNALIQTDLTHLAGEKPLTLSGGERQRVAVARAIVAEPAYLIADEPTAHQDLGHTRALLAIFQRRAREGSVVIIAGHDQRLQETDGADDCYELQNKRLTAK